MEWRPLERRWARPVGCPPEKLLLRKYEFMHRAGKRDRERQAVAKPECADEVPPADQPRRRRKKSPGAVTAHVLYVAGTPDQ
ncbi:MAG: hypothetical protein ACYSUI_02440 [Planctomycetota bacterium]|jgi:hypothetical protein